MRGLALILLLCSQIVHADPEQVYFASWDVQSGQFEPSSGNGSAPGTASSNLPFGRYTGINPISAPQMSRGGRSALGLQLQLQAWDRECLYYIAFSNWAIQHLETYFRDAERAAESGDNDTYGDRLDRLINGRRVIEEAFTRESRMNTGNMGSPSRVAIVKRNWERAKELEASAHRLFHPFAITDRQINRIRSTEWTNPCTGCELSQCNATYARTEATRIATENPRCCPSEYCTENFATELAAEIEPRLSAHNTIVAFVAAAVESFGGAEVILQNVVRSTMSAMGGGVPFILPLQNPEELLRQTNPYAGPVEEPVVVVDPSGNAIPVGTGESLTGSPDGRWVQVRDAEGNPTGVRVDNGHPATRHPDTRAQHRHGHVPGVTNPDGTPWLPVR
jgi:hypothetical protein